MTKNILIVEYDIKTIDMIKETFLYPSLHFDIAEDGLKAKEIMEENDYDLVIVAAMLPKFHGFQLSEFISKKYPDTKIIIMSGIYKGIEYKQQAISQFKANDFFEKPLNKEILKDKVLDLLDLDLEELENSNPGFDQKAMIDTTKIPTLKELEQEETKLTSDDIFGDIIKDVEQSNEKNDILPETPLEKKTVNPKKDPSLSQTKKIDLNSLNEMLVKPERKNSVKKIEDEISKKLEDTLSGLGLSSNKPKPKKVIKTQPENIVEQAHTEDKTEEKKTEEKYDILGLIARGGMAEIYKAKKRGVKGFKKIIALKKILSGYGEDDKFIEMFVDEARIAAELSHPNIVQIYDFEKRDDTYLIAMEFVLGKDLRNILKKTNKENIIIPEEISLYIIKNILDALSYAHSAKDDAGNSMDIVHRDVSPPNILISYSGEVKLTDFGVSKAANKMHQTISGALKGKLLYMSPEQAKGERNIDWRADLYSVGVILFELLTGQKLFIDNSEMAVLKKVQEGVQIDFKQFENINNELKQIIAKSLDKSRENRYQSANDMIADINEYISNTFSPQPSSIHLSHFIYNLFKQEIIDQNLKVELKPVPANIKRIKKEIPDSPPELPEIKEDFDIPEKISEDIKETELIELGAPIDEINEHEEVNETEIESEKIEIKPNADYSPAIDISLSINEDIAVEDKEEEMKPTMTLDEIEKKLKTQNKDIEPEIIQKDEPVSVRIKEKSSKKIFISIAFLAVIIIIYLLFSLGILSKGKEKPKGPAILSPTEINIVNNLTYKKDSKTPFTGFVENRMNNAEKSLKERVEYKEGLKNGTYKYFYDNKTLKREGLYLKGKKNGLWVVYDKKGKKINETNYLNGKKNGKEIIRDKTGNIISNKIYKNGVEISGKVIKYHIGTNKIKEEFFYKNKEIIKKRSWNLNGDRLIEAIITNKFRQNKLQIGRRTRISFELNEDDFKKMKKDIIGDILLKDTKEILVSIKVIDIKKKIAKVFDIKNKKRTITVEKDKISLIFIIPKELPKTKDDISVKNPTDDNKTDESVNNQDDKSVVDKNKEDELKKEAEKKRLKEEADKKKKAADEKKKRDAKIAEEKRLEEENARIAEAEKKKQEQIDAENKRIEQEKLLKQQQEEKRRKELKVGDVVIDVDTRPQPISVNTPKLSRKLRKKMSTDTLQMIVSLLVDENGRVIKVKRVRKSGIPEIDLEVSRIIVKEWKFKPATKYNKKVKTWFTKQIILKK